MLFISLFEVGILEFGLNVIIVRDITQYNNEKNKVNTKDKQKIDNLEA